MSESVVSQSRIKLRLNHRFWVSASHPYPNLAALLFLIAFAGTSNAQMALGSSSSDAQSGVAASSPSPSTATAASPSALAPESTNQLSPVSLSSDQIINLLQQSPDLVVELKSEVADRLQQQGTEVDANDISDEMLYDEIATNATLRAGITTFLRARGYVSDDQLRTAMPDPANGAGSLSAGSLPRSTSTSAGSGNMQLGGGPGARAEEQGDTPFDLVPPLRQTTAGSGVHASLGGNRNQVPPPASTDAPNVLRKAAPYNLLAMRDLYTQIPENTAPLRRFGSDVFTDRTLTGSRSISSRDMPLDVPIGPDYILGAGDTLTVDIWGGANQSINRAVGRDGRLLLPEAGSLEVAGLPLAKAQSLIEDALRKQYRGVNVAVTVSHMRTVRIYVTGDVQRPGAYNVSSLASSLSALYAAGGPTAVGSLRTAMHYRGALLIEVVNLYDFLLHGVRNADALFESGDTLLVPPAGPQVAVSGAVKRPAIYELKGGESVLTTVIADSGGFTASASLSHITIERIGANHTRETVTVDASSSQDPAAAQKTMAAFAVRDGDRIRVEPILPYSERAVYLEGHVVRPGRRAYVDGMKLGDLLHSYRDMLPEPSAHGEVVRLIPPDLHAMTIGFDLAEVMIGNGNVDLQPFDTVRILGRYEADAPKVSIFGEVLRPGIYPMSVGMSAAQLVLMAGGFKRDALRTTAELTSYRQQQGQAITGELATVRIGDAVSGADATADVALKPGDILTVRQLTGWNDIGQSVTIQGQARFPGIYGFQDGERLSSVLRRAGGLLATAYPEGAVLIRDQVRDLEQKSRDELIRQIETNSATARLGPGVISEGGNALQAIKAQQEELIAELKNHPPTGRMVIHISAGIDSWANTPADIELRSGDVLTLPKRPGFILVTGQVYNATALTYAPDRAASWYLSHAGGSNGSANRKEIFIIRSNGSVIGRHSGGRVLSTRLYPGDVVVVPMKIIGGSLVWRNILATIQAASSVALSAGVVSAL